MKNQTQKVRSYPAAEPECESAEFLRQRYAQLCQQQPRLRLRNAAIELGVPEGVLLASQVGGGDVVRLNDTPEDILRSLLPLGEVMGVTRNAWAVHECRGVYSNASFFEHGDFKQGLFVNADIDLRLFMNHWRFCFAVTEQVHGGVLKGLQFFDKAGAAVHKIYLTERSSRAAYDALTARFAARMQTMRIDVEPYAPRRADRPDSEIDWPGLRAAWSKLRGTHQFFPMLRRFHVGREQALRRIGDDFARRVTADSLRRALDLASANACPLTVLVGNRGCMQGYSGAVREVAAHGPWYNVLDRNFNLHVREDCIASAWVTRKPTEDGVVTALELFGARGEAILSLFGQRRPGVSEMSSWRDIACELETVRHRAAGAFVH